MLVCFSKFFKDKELMLLEVLFCKIGEKDLTFLTILRMVVVINVIHFSLFKSLLSVNLSKSSDLI